MNPSLELEVSMVTKYSDRANRPANHISFTQDTGASVDFNNLFSLLTIKVTLVNLSLVGKNDRENIIEELEAFGDLIQILHASQAFGLPHITLAEAML